MSTRLEYPHEGCLFSAMSFVEEIAFEINAFFSYCVVVVVLSALCMKCSTYNQSYVTVITYAMIEMYFYLILQCILI